MNIKMKLDQSRLLGFKLQASGDNKSTQRCGTRIGKSQSASAGKLGAKIGTKPSPVKLDTKV